MNVFVLNTGRCGSTTFIQACRHISNFSCGHETRVSRLGNERLDYAANHIEADNRLSWLLGRLDARYGGQAFYVHLTRAREATVASFAKRCEFGIMKAYREGILMAEPECCSPEVLAQDYIATVESNIRHFLADKPRQMEFRLEQAKRDFRVFWELIGARGGLDRALSEWDTAYNASD